jgi:hypothetical protein
MRMPPIFQQIQASVGGIAAAAAAMTMLALSHLEFIPSYYVNICTIHSTNGFICGKETADSRRSRYSHCCCSHNHIPSHHMNIQQTFIPAAAPASCCTRQLRHRGQQQPPAATPVSRHSCPRHPLASASISVTHLCTL